MYTEVISGSKWVSVVVKNLTAILITIAKGVKAIQVVVANAVPPVEIASGDSGDNGWDTGYPVD